MGKCYEAKKDAAKAAGFYKKILTLVSEEDALARKVKKALRDLEGGQSDGHQLGRLQPLPQDLPEGRRDLLRVRARRHLLPDPERAGSQIVKIMGDIEKTIDILQPGELFGEMAILEEAPRSATAIALDQVTALEFNRENFES